MLFVLSAGSYLLQRSKSAMENILVAFIHPSVLHVVLFPAGHVVKSVAIVVVVLEDVLVMEKHFRSPFVRKMHVGIGIRLDTALGVAEEVHLHLLFILRLEIVHVNLSCDRLISVFHGSTTLRHLDAFHPRSRHIAEGIRDGSPAVVGQILGEHLHVSARKAEELDLSCPRRSIVVSHIHRRIGGKALAKVAASRLEEFVLVHGNAIHSTCQSGSTRLASHHVHLLQGLVLEDRVSGSNILWAGFFPYVICVSSSASHEQGTEQYMFWIHFSYYLINLNVIIQSSWLQK